MFTRTALRTLALTFLLLPGALARVAAEAPAPYDPLAAPGVETVSTQDFTITDQARSRDIPIRVYALPETKSAPVVLFSHGLGGSRENGAYLGNHWAARGYVCVFMQHAGSDESVWKDAGRGQRLNAMRDAASGENLLLRVKDVPAVIDQLAVWNQEQGHALAGRMDLAHIGMSGHSFGAVTTQSVSGQVAARGLINGTDPRIQAACAFSPSSPRAGSVEAAFGSVRIPWMLMTGTEDVSPIGGIDVESRLAVYPALPAGGKYEVVLFGAKHGAFGDGTQRRLDGARNPNHHKVILALSTAFWDAWLKKDEAAKTWLDGEGPKSVLEEKDRWQRK
jgi:predicted dienelactone hydrolase